MNLDRFRIPGSERDPIAAIIARRRRQILIHSIIYYGLDDSLVPDARFDEWCRDLVELQEAFPERRDEGPYAEAFSGFTGATGFDLPLHDPGALERARSLLRGRGRRRSRASDR